MMEQMIDRRETDPGFDLASTLLGAWLLGDAAMRIDLDRAIRAYVARHPSFQGDLRRALEHNELVREAARAGRPIPPIPPRD
jgi:hypothetical protein